MSDHSKERGHHRDHNAPKDAGGDGKRWYHAPHRSWIFWVAVLLMLAGMGAYLSTFFASKTPDGKPAEPMPTAAP